MGCMTNISTFCQDPTTSQMRFIHLHIYIYIRIYLYIHVIFVQVYRYIINLAAYHEFYLNYWIDKKDIKNIYIYILEQPLCSLFLYRHLPHGVFPTKAILGQVVCPHCGNLAPLTETPQLKRLRRSIASCAPPPAELSVSLAETIAHSKYPNLMALERERESIHVWYIYLHLVDSYGKCR